MNDRVTIVSREEMLRRIAGEYLEMPGLKLTAQQAQRLWGLDADVCTSLLADLVASNFLVRTTTGQYSRATDGPSPFPRPRMARTTLPPPTAPAKAS